MTTPSSDPYERLGEAIKELRLERGATRNQVKEAAKISLEYLGKIEQGKRTPQPDVLARIATALGSTPAELLDRARSPHNRVFDPAAGTGAFLINAMPAIGALSLVRAARDLQRHRSSREELLEELEHRLGSLDDDELALLVASIPRESHEAGADQTDD